MNDFKERFKHLTFNQNPNEDKTKNSDKDDNDEVKNQVKKPNIQNKKTSYAKLKELLKTISENTEQDKIFILLLINMLKSKKASNELILALLYIFL